MRIIEWWLPVRENCRPAYFNSYEAKSLQLTLTACYLAHTVLNIWSYLRLPGACYPMADLPCRDGILTRWNYRPCSAALPYTPLSHPFIERLIGTIRREFLDHTLFWNAADLERKLADFQAYYNQHRTHSSLGGDTPSDVADGKPKLQTTLNNFHWQTHCRGLFQFPAAA